MKRALTLLPIAALALAACGSDDDTASGISIEGAWARTSAEGQTTGAIYFEITSDEADTLVAASVPASVAAEVQIHEVVPADMGADDGAMDEGSMDEGSMDEGSMDDGAMGEDSSADHGSMDDGSMDEGSVDDGSMDDGSMDGGMDMAMTMRELADGLPLPAGETVTLQPGGYHVMMLDLAEPLEVGDEIELTLDFATADDMTLTVEVAESAP